MRPVFTAHPTEAARQSLLTKLREVADLLDAEAAELATTGGTTTVEATDRRLSQLIDLVWLTDELRLTRPEPVDEARNAVYYLVDLQAGALGDVLDDLQRTLVGLDVPLRRRPVRCRSARASVVCRAMMPIALSPFGRPSWVVGIGWRGLAGTSAANASPSPSATLPAATERPAARQSSASARAVRTATLRMLSSSASRPPPPSERNGACVERSHGRRSSASSAPGLPHHRAKAVPLSVMRRSTSDSPNPWPMSSLTGGDS